MRYVILTFTLVFLAQACTRKKTPTPDMLFAKKVAQQYGSGLQKKLFDKVAAAGLVKALGYCKETAIPEAKKVSDEMTAEAKNLGYSGLEVKRVSLLNRNPQNTPDERQSNVLKNWLNNHKIGQLPEPDIYHDAQRTEILIPIGMQNPACLSCHGSADLFTPELKKELKKLYPQDKATGYKLGDLRGAFVVKMMK